MDVFVVVADVTLFCDAVTAAGGASFSLVSGLGLTPISLLHTIDVFPGLSKLIIFTSLPGSIFFSTGRSTTIATGSSSFFIVGSSFFTSFLSSIFGVSTAFDVLADVFCDVVGVDAGQDRMSTD